MALALSLGMLLLFRGATSILTGFFIPLILLLFTKEKQVFWVTGGSLLILSSMFFPQQSLFVAGYIGLSAVFITGAKRKFFYTAPLLAFGLYVGFTSMVLFLGILFTEMLFLVPLHTMMLRLSGGRGVVYLGIVMLEGLLMSAFHGGVYLQVRKRLPKL